MTTPLEDAVIASFVADLGEKGLSEEIVAGIAEAFSAAKLPTADAIADLINTHSGDRIA